MTRANEAQLSILSIAAYGNGIISADSDLARCDITATH